MQQIQELQPLKDPDQSLPFVGEVLKELRKEVGKESTVLGFIGAPWTLAAYAIEGKADKWEPFTSKILFPTQSNFPL